MAKAITIHAKETKDTVSYPATLITPGVYTPGMGNTMGFRFLFTEAFLKKVAAGFTGHPVNLDHRHDTEYEVGHIDNARWEDGGVKADLVLHRSATKFVEAQSFVESRLAQGLIPNVSIEITDEQFLLNQDAKLGYDAEVVEGKPVGVAILPVGACTPEDGCGIGLRKADGILMLGHVNYTNMVVPTDPDTTDMDDEPWTTPGFSDYAETNTLEGSFEDQSDETRKAFASHHAWAQRMPPTSLSHLKLQHHRPDGSVSIRGVRTALASLPKTSGIPTSERARVKAHLQQHLTQWREHASRETEEKKQPEGNHMSGQTTQTDGSPPPTQVAAVTGCACGGSGAKTNLEGLTATVTALKADLEAATKRETELQGRLDKVEAKDVETLRTEMTGLRTELAAAKEVVEARNTELTAAQAAQKTAEDKVAAFMEAEHTATIDAFKAEAKARGLKDEYVTQVLGDSPTLEAAQIALKSLQLSSSGKTRTELSGRVTAANPREGQELVNRNELVASHYANARVRLGLERPKSTNPLPPALARNTARLGLARPTTTTESDA